MARSAASTWLVMATVVCAAWAGPGCAHASPAASTFRFANVYGDHMVLQQRTWLCGSGANGCDIVTVMGERVWQLAASVCAVPCV